MIARATGCLKALAGSTSSCGCALAVLTDAVDRLEPGHDRQPGQGCGVRSSIARVIDLGRAGSRPHQLDPLDPVLVADPVDQHAMLVTP